MKDYTIQCDLKQEKFQNIKLVQGDSGNVIKINVFENGQPVDLTNCDILAKYKRADGYICNGDTQNKSDNHFEAIMSKKITGVAGVLQMLFEITQGDIKVSTFIVSVDIDESIGDISQNPPVVEPPEGMTYLAYREISSEIGSIPD